MCFTKVYVVEIGKCYSVVKILRENIWLGQLSTFGIRNLPLTFNEHISFTHSIFFYKLYDFHMICVGMCSLLCPRMVMVAVESLRA